jgi:hypothetical protein
MDHKAVLTNWKTKEKGISIWHPRGVTAVCFSRNENEFFVASEGFHVTMHNAETGDQLRVLPLEYP